MDTPTNTARRHARWLEQQRQEDALNRRRAEVLRAAQESGHLVIIAVSDDAESGAR